MSKIANRVHQVQKTYKPVLAQQYTTSFGYNVRNYSTQINYTPIEIIGAYDANHDRNVYSLSDRIVITIARKIIAEQEKVFDFDSSYDVPIGSKIEIDGQKYAVTDKKYQLNGVIDSYIEDTFLKCVDYDKQYEKIKGEASDLLLEKREKEIEIRSTHTENKAEKKKSIWWYLGIR